MEKMPQVLVEAVGHVAVVEASVPAPGYGEVRVHTRLAGICGSDTHALAGHHPLLPPPYLPGHEAVGTVSALGAGVGALEVGQRVVLKPNLSCGRCVNCAAGRTNACQQLRWIGCDPSGALPGAMAGEFLAPASSLYPVPDDVTDEQAVLVEPLATPVHAVRIAGDLTDGRVAVIGAGTIGLFCVIAAKRAGAGTVVVSDLDPGKRERALRHGADVALEAGGDVATAAQAALGGPADAVFDCVATEGSARSAVSLLRHAGTLLVVGVPAGDFALPMPLVQDWELRVQGCANYTAADVQVALAMARTIPAPEIIAGRFPLARAAEAFERAAMPSAGKVVLTTAGGD